MLISLVIVTNQLPKPGDLWVDWDESGVRAPMKSNENQSKQRGTDQDDVDENDNKKKWWRCLCNGNSLKRKMSGSGKKHNRRATFSSTRTHQSFQSIDRPKYCMKQPIDMGSLRNWIINVIWLQRVKFNIHHSRGHEWIDDTHTHEREEKNTRTHDVWMNIGAVNGMATDRFQCNMSEMNAHRQQLWRNAKGKKNAIIIETLFIWKYEYIGLGTHASQWTVSNNVTHIFHSLCMCTYDEAEI